MDEQKRTSGPAFEKARDLERMLIVRLTPEQRKEYDALQQEHVRVADNALAGLKADTRNDLMKLTRANLAEGFKLDFRRGSQNQFLDRRTLKQMQDAVPDHINGKNTPHTKLFASQLTKAHDKAANAIERTHQLSLAPLQAKQKEEMGKFLKQCAKDRGEPVLDRTKDPAFIRAYEMVAKQEAARDRRENENQRDDDLYKPR